MLNSTCTHLSIKISLKKFYKNWASKTTFHKSIAGTVRKKMLSLARKNMPVGSIATLVG